VRKVWPPDKGRRFRHIQYETSDNYLVDRCHRMKKACQPSPPVRRQRTLKRSLPHEIHNHGEKTLNLEEKIDGLVTLLKSATQAVTGTTTSTFVNSSQVGLVPAIHGSAPRPIGNSNISYGEYTHSSASTDRSRSNYTPSSPSPSHPASLSNLDVQPVLHPALEPSPEDAELCLNRFRNSFIKHLPFIVLAPSVTAHELRQQRPLLWISIMTVAVNNSTQQISLSKEVRGILAREVFVKGTRNMDLLLAILVYTTW
jgi:hypothetical protein